MAPKTNNFDETPLFHYKEERKAHEPGEVESAWLAQIATLTEQGIITPSHAGITATVVHLARAVDNISPTDAASGRSALYRTLTEASERLPKAQGTGQDFLKLKALINAPIPELEYVYTAAKEDA